MGTIFSVILFLSLVQVILSNSLSTTGIDLSKIEEEVSIYKNENYVLREKLLLATSLTQVASSAAVLGFTNSKSNIYIDSSVPVAIKQ